jgi:hypothetical protein
MSDTNICYGGNFRSPLDAVFTLTSLPRYGFILYCGKVIQRMPRGYRSERGGAWSLCYKEPLHALAQIR